MVKAESDGRIAGRRSLTATALLVVALGSTGCFGGGIYSHTTFPLDVDMNSTPRKPDHSWGSWRTLVLPLYVAELEFDWGSIGIADAARAQGIEKVQYADLETLSVMGVWTQRWIHVYGE